MYIPPSVKCSRIESGHTNFLRLLSIKFAFGIKKHTNPLSNSISFDLYGLVCVRLYVIFALSSRTPRARRSGVPFASSLHGRCAALADCFLGGIRSAEILRYVAVRCHFSTNRRLSQATPLEDDTAERQPLGASLLQYAGGYFPFY